MSTVRILHCITSLDPDGAQRMLLRLIRALQPLGIESVVISLREPLALSSQFADAGIEVHYLGMKKGVPGPAALLKMRRIVAQVRPDGAMGWMYHANLALWLATRGLKHSFPVLWNMRRSLDDMHTRSTLTRMVVKANALLSSRVQGLIYQNELCARGHEEHGFSRKNRHLLPNGFDTTRLSFNLEARRLFRAELGISDDDILIGSVGRYDPCKGHVRMIDAVALLMQIDPRIRLALIGPQISRDNGILWSRICELGMENQVYLLGAREDVPTVLSGLDIYIQASENEGFPNAVAEAMLCQVPCVATDTGATREIVEGVGVIPDSIEPNDLATALLRMLAFTEEERERMEVAGRQRIVERYSLESVTNQYAQVLHRAIQEHARKKGRTPAAGQAVPG